MPSSRRPGFAISVGPGPFARLDAADEDHASPSCAGNIVAGNHVEAHPDGILIIHRPGIPCRGTVVRDNTIVVRRVPVGSGFDVQLTDETDPTVVGVPLGVHNLGGSAATGDERGQAPLLEENLIEGNRIIGAESSASRSCMPHATVS